MRIKIELNEVKSYATEANLEKALKKLGLDNFTYGEEKNAPMQYIVTRTPEGRWTAVFLVTNFFRGNSIGGYLGIAAQHGFLSV